MLPNTLLCIVESIINDTYRCQMDTLADTSMLK